MNIGVHILRTTLPRLFDHVWHLCRRQQNDRVRCGTTQHHRGENIHCCSLVHTGLALNGDIDEPECQGVLLDQGVRL